MISNSLKQTVCNYISTHHLLDITALHLVALSGGADSTALLIIMKQLGYRIEAIHCNFHLRGEESDRDEKFCESLCEEQNIPFHRVHFDTLSYAELHKMSIEMAARKLRYDYFEQLRRTLDANDILVAHHQEDNVETILINLIRGTGIHGLRGIQPKNGHIVRPLLSVSRKDIEVFLEENGQKFVTDSTNLKDDVVRNKIRLDIIPLLKSINPAVINNIDSTSKHLSEASDIVDDSLEKFISNKKEIVCYLPTGTDSSSCPTSDEDTLDTGAVININVLDKYSSPQYALYYILEKYDFSGMQVEQIYANLHNGSGRTWKSTSHELVVDRDNIIVKRICKDYSGKVMKIPEDGLYNYDSTHSFHIKRQSIKNFRIIKDSNIACLDADKVKFPITIRRVEQGDRFIPFGMKGSKLVSDYLTDRKCNLFEKKQQLVVTDAEGNIIWLAFQRIDNRFCIGDKTKNVLTINL